MVNTKWRKNNAVFLAKIDFNDETKRQLGELKPGRGYRLSSLESNDENKIKEVEYNTIKEKIVGIIENDIKQTINESTIIHVKSVAILGEYNGSIEVLFSVVFTALGVISGIKDLYDSVQIIKEISRTIIKKGLEKERVNYFDVTLKTISPMGADNYSWREKHYYGDIRESEDCQCKKRDAFFYYLLVSNIVLLFTLGAMVFKAVTTIYF